MVALFINGDGYIYAQHSSITFEELTSLGIDHVMVDELPSEMVNQREDQLVKVVSRDPLVLELEDIPAPPEPPKTPEQERIEQLESQVTSTMIALTEVYEEKEQQIAQKETEVVTAMSAITELYEMNLQLLERIEQLEAANNVG